MVNPKPKVSIGVPVYNGERWLSETIVHLRAQDFTDIEIVISDNGSTDATPQICRAAAAEDPRIRFHRSEQNMGTGWNFNHVLALARAPLFMWNAADDLIAPSYISKCVAALEDDPTAVNAFSRVLLIDPDAVVIGALGDVDLDFTATRPSDRVDHFLRRQAVHIEYGIMHTEQLRAWGGEPPIHGGDVVLGVTMLLTGPAIMVPEQLFSARRHGEQGSMLRRADQQLREHRPDARLRPVFPQWRIVGECARRICTASLPAAERARCLRVLVLGWVVPRRRSYASDIKRNLLMAFHLVTRRRSA